MLILLLFIGYKAGAQDLSKQLEVTREYSPQVDPAEKLPVVPRIPGVEEMKLQTPYSINSTARPTVFEMTPYEPARIDGFGVDKILYLRAGAGVPFQTTADIYYTPRLKRGGTLGVFGNHRGSFSRIMNDLDITTSATEAYGELGIFGTREWPRYTLNGDITYAYFSYSPYGSSNVDVAEAMGLAEDAVVNRYFGYNSESDRFNWGKLQGRLSFGDRFTDLSHLNYRIAFDGAYVHEIEQVDINFNVRTAQMFRTRGGVDVVEIPEGETARHDRWIEQGFEAVLWGRSALDARESALNASAFVLSPRYVLKVDDFSFSAGLDFRFTSTPIFAPGGARVADNYLSWSPAVDARIELAQGGFVPFVKYSTQLLDGSVGASVSRNPYARYGGFAPMGWSGDLRAGFEGDLDDLFNYSLSGGVSWLDNYHIFAARQNVSVYDNGEGRLYKAYYEPVGFVPMAVSGKRYTVGAQLGLHDLGGFSAQLYVNWNGFDLDEWSAGVWSEGGWSQGALPEMPEVDLPPFDARLELSYVQADKFIIRAGAYMMGERKFNSFYYLNDGWEEGATEPTGIASERHYTSSVDRIGVAVDVYASAEVKIVKDLWIFAEGKNLANQQLYPFVHYRGLGIGIMGGVKILW